MNENNTQNVIPNVDSKSKEERNVPDLRFDDKPWEACFVSDFYEVQMCKRVFANQTNNISGVPFFKIGTLGSTCDSYISYELFEEYKSKYKYPRKGEVLMTCSGTVGRCLKFNGKDSYFQDSNIVWLRSDNSPICNEFLFILLSNYEWNKLNSTTITRIYNNDIYSIKLKFPPDIKIQQKIVDLYTFLDKRIDTQRKIIDSLKTLIISIKNKEFYNIVGIKHKLEDILMEINNKTIENKQYEVLSSTVKGIYKQSEYFDRAVASENNTGYKIVKKGNIVISPQNLWMGNISYNDKFEIGIVSPSYKVFNVNNKFNEKYIFEMLTTKKSLYLFKTVSEQGASIVRRNLNFEAFMQLTFNIPDNKHQNDFIEKLNLLQNKLSLENKILSLYEQQKQYLLDKLFI